MGEGLPAHQNKAASYSLAAVNLIRPLRGHLLLNQEKERRKYPECPRLAQSYRIASLCERRETARLEPFLLVERLRVRPG